MSLNSLKVTSNCNSELITDETVIQQLGERIRQLRLRKNRTQTDLAKDSGVGKSTIERFERGASIQLTSLVRILRALGKLDDLLGLVPDQSNSPVNIMLREQPKKYRASKKRVSADEKEWKWGDE